MIFIGAIGGGDKEGEGESKEDAGGGGEDPEVEEMRREAERKRKEKHEKAEAEREELRQSIRDKVIHKTRRFRWKVVIEKPSLETISWQMGKW